MESPQLRLGRSGGILRRLGRTRRHQGRRVKVIAPAVIPSLVVGAGADMLQMEGLTVPAGADCF